MNTTITWTSKKGTEITVTIKEDDSQEIINELRETLMKIRSDQ